MHHGKVRPSMEGMIQPGRYDLLAIKEERWSKTRDQFSQARSTYTVREVRVTHLQRGKHIGSVRQGRCSCYRSRRKRGQRRRSRRQGQQGQMQPTRAGEINMIRHDRRGQAQPTLTVTICIRRGDQHRQQGTHDRALTHAGRRLRHVVITTLPCKDDTNAASIDAPGRKCTLR